MFIKLMNFFFVEEKKILWTVIFFYFIFLHQFFYFDLKVSLHKKFRRNENPKSQFFNYYAVKITFKLPEDSIPRKFRGECAMRTTHTWHQWRTENPTEIISCIKTTNFSWSLNWKQVHHTCEVEGTGSDNDNYLKTECSHIMPQYLIFRTW